MSTSDLLPYVVELAAAIAVVLGWIATARLAAAAPRDDGALRSSRPAWWRWTRPVVELGATAFASAIPPRRRTAIEGRLRAAGLEGTLDAPALVSGQALAALAGAAVATFGSAAAAALRAAPDGTVPLGGGWLALADGASPLAAAVGGAFGWAIVGAWLAERRTRRAREVLRALPFVLDVIVLSVESGANLTGALAHAVAKGPPGPLRDEIGRALADVRTGRPRADALRAMAARLDSPAVSSWIAALVAAERHGSSLGPVLRAQAEQRRQERFADAEERAMKAPVKMLFPLLAFVFPCTFVLLFFPVAVRLFQEGLLR